MMERDFNDRGDKNVNKNLVKYNLNNPKKPAELIKKHNL